MLVLVKECGANAKAVNESGNNALWEAAYGEHTDTVRALVSECGEDPDVANERGYPLVCMQAMCDNLDVVRELVKCKADPNTADQTGRTPVFWAANLKLTDMVQLLVRDCNADPYIADNRGVTPLCRAATYGCLLTTKSSDYRSSCKVVVLSYRTRTLPYSPAVDLKVICCRFLILW